MARLNVPNKFTEKTHEGGPASRITPTQALKRTVLATMLWEDNFYENGEDVATRVKKLIPEIPARDVAIIAREARNKQKLRHMPLYMARELARHPDFKRPDTPARIVSQLLEDIIQRPDELSEFLAIYWKDKKQPLSAQVKKGLASAFTKFTEYQLAKYNRDGAVKLRDVLFLSHAKPKNKEQERLFKSLVDGTLKTPDTWEVELSKGEGKKTEENKKESWERLLRERKMGALALLRNLRNFREASVDPILVRSALAEMKPDRVLPFRFITAAKYAPDLEPELESLMFKCLENTEPLEGHTCLLIDISGSMDAPISSKSELKRNDAAIAVAMLLREITRRGSVFAFSNDIHQVPARRGFGLRDAILRAPGYNGGTQLGHAISVFNREQHYIKADRLIVITDEQSADRVPTPLVDKAYMINVGSNKNGVGYGNKWTHIDGWSEAVIDYIREFERIG